MAKVRNRPKTPAQIAAARLAQRVRDFAAVELQPEVAALATSDDIHVRRDGQKTVAGARRFDAFDALREGMVPGAYDAARRLERDMRIQRGEADKGRGLFRVDGEESKHGPMDRKFAAAKRVRDALARVGDRDALLLTELIYPTRPVETWRETAAYITGEENPVAQAAVVRSACANLALAYDTRKAA